MKYHLFWCNMLWSAGSPFFTSDNFQGIIVDFRFMINTKVLMKELARVLIHVQNILNGRMSFKMLFLMCLLTAEKKLYNIVTSGIALSKKLPQQWRKSLSSRYTFLTLLLKKNKNELTEYHGISIPFKSQVH